MGLTGHTQAARAMPGGEGAVALFPDCSPGLILVAGPVGWKPSSPSQLHKSTLPTNAPQHRMSQRSCVGFVSPELVTRALSKGPGPRPPRPARKGTEKRVLTREGVLLLGALWNEGWWEGSLQPAVSAAQRRDSAASRDLEAAG